MAMVQARLSQFVPCAIPACHQPIPAAAAVRTTGGPCWRCQLFNALGRNRGMPTSPRAGTFSLSISSNSSRCMRAANLDLALHPSPGCHKVSFFALDIALRLQQVQVVQRPDGCFLLLLDLLIVYLLHVLLELLTNGGHQRFLIPVPLSVEPCQQQTIFVKLDGTSACFSSPPSDGKNVAGGGRKCTFPGPVPRCVFSGWHNHLLVQLGSGARCRS
mmetsp:Transcript_21263/g.54064  ORF Transcript_21263/g.54064 Transcript_21263/m.54064 type:complete len:216 (+) Transcript_21263:356-1003(+)